MTFSDEVFLGILRVKLNSIYESAEKKRFIFYKNPIFGMSFSLIGKGDDMCRKIVKEEFFLPLLD